MAIPYDSVVFYKLDNHDDIHLKVGARLEGFPYAPETFRSLFLEAQSRCSRRSLRAVCDALPFSQTVNDEVFAAELSAEISESILIDDNSSYDTIVSPCYLSPNEVAYILQAKGVTFSDVVEADGQKCPTIDPFSTFAFERDYFGGTIGELRSIREIASHASFTEPDDDLRLCRDVGAKVIGPVYALYAEWVARVCRSHGISLLLPMMREATVLMMCINELADIPCKPLYCSRRALFNASINAANFDDKLQQVLMKSKASPGILCNDIGIDLSGTPFLRYKTLSDLQSQGSLGGLEQYIRERKSEVLSHSAYQRECFGRYLLSLAGEEKSATVDIGFSGTSERLIRDIVAMSNIDLDISHLILMGADGAQIDNILDRLRIYSWLGMAGENTDTTRRLMYQIQVIEPLINDIGGTTLSYGENGPVLDCELPSELASNDRKALACQRGIRDFVKQWKRYRSHYDVNSLLEEKIGFINMLRRLIETPTYGEAEVIGDLLLYDNYTEEKKVYTVRGNEVIADVDSYLSSVSRSKSDYPQANVVMQYPDYFKLRLMEKAFPVPGIERMVQIVEELRDCNARNIAVFTAGQRGRDFNKVAQHMGLEIDCFIDSNSRLQGNRIDGIPVCSIDEAPGIRFFINASYNYPDEVRDIIAHSSRDRDVVVYDFE